MKREGHMRGRDQLAWRIGALVAGWLLFPAWVLAQPPEIRVAATTNQKRPIELSDTLRVALTIEGPAPLRIEFAKNQRGNGKEVEQILGDESNRDWKIARLGAPVRTPLGNDRERWVQVFQLEPYVARGPTTILFAPIRVNNREIPGPGCDVTVNPPAIDAKPGAAMTITDIEELPPPSPAPGSQRLGLWIGLVLGLAIGIAIRMRIHRRPKPIPPHEWAVAAFDRLQQASSPGATLVDGVAAVVRGFIDRRFGIAATRLTTEELLVAVEQAGWPIEQTDSLCRLLEECDRAKFAGDIPDDDGCRRLLARGREWVDQVRPDSGPA